MPHFNTVFTVTKEGIAKVEPENGLASIESFLIKVLFSLALVLLLLSLSLSLACICPSSLSTLASNLVMPDNNLQHGKTTILLQCKHRNCRCENCGTISDFQEISTENVTNLRRGRAANLRAEEKRKGMVGFESSFLPQIGGMAIPGYFQLFQSPPTSPSSALGCRHRFVMATPSSSSCESCIRDPN
ncbi:hypothetical protein TIFTF001_006478 [Ficus carica]|uniref:Uncharacterized protein n=1 Tax=Ficus carica TaxID=3494 RepID=A0AA88CYS1_FICCA|nr:hypothetical protein TIFTF001_006478 [Ficus carica]